MAETPRYLASQVLSDLERKTVFVAGPRQVGKTTLARNLPGATDTYLNWDIAELSPPKASAWRPQGG